MRAAAADALGEEAILYEDKLNYKPPRVGSSYPLHQDRSYWMQLAPGVPSTDRLVTVTVMLDDATVENGCLRLVRCGLHHFLRTVARWPMHSSALVPHGTATAMHPLSPATRLQLHVLVVPNEQEQMAYMPHSLHRWHPAR